MRRVNAVLSVILAAVLVIGAVAVLPPVPSAAATTAAADPMVDMADCDADRTTCAAKGACLACAAILPVPMLQGVRSRAVGVATVLDEGSEWFMPPELRPPPTIVLA